jgi:DNA-binding HxlR family transcriptional regulator
MTSTHKKVSASQSRHAASRPTEESRAAEEALKAIEGRWKLRILFSLNASAVMRFSELERAIPEVTQKMLAQQLRELERDGLVARKVHDEVPPRVEYSLTQWGQELCPALDELRAWASLDRRSISK